MERKIFNLGHFLILICIIIFSGLLVAQTPTGKIIGKITDEEGSLLPGVSVVGTSQSLQGEATTVTDSYGNYRLLSLPPGIYQLKFSISGFKTIVREKIDLDIEQTLTVNVQLELGVMEEEVTVIGVAPIIDLKSTTQGKTIGKEMFASLPKGRSYDSVVNIIAGVSSEERLGGESIDGASGLENMFYIDGMDTGDLFLGNVKQEAAFEFVEEIQVKASGYQAEYGGSLGGVVNVVTRSGGNEYHGEVIGYYSGSILTSKERDTLRLNPFDLTEAEYVNYQDLYGKGKVNRWEIGFGLGGYILKDRLWFFGSFLPVFQNTERNINWLTGDIKSGTYSENYRWYNFIGKLSFKAVEGLRLAATVINNSSSYTGMLPSRDGRGDSSFPYDQDGFSYPNWTATLSADLIVGNNFLINAHAGYFTTDTRNQKIQPTEERYTFEDTNAIYPELVDLYPDYIRAAGYGNYSYGSGLVTNKELYSRFSVRLDATYFLSLAGDHAFKGGFLLVNLTTDLDSTNKFDYFNFYWGQDYYIPGQEDVVYKGKYGMYSVNYANPPGPDQGEFGKVKSNRLAFYLQDSWTIADRFTLNFGVRAEREDVPSFSDIPEYAGTVLEWGFADKIAPRFGLVYDVFGNGNTKAFASFGIYYDVLKMALAVGAYGAVRARTNWYTLEDPEWWTYKTGYYPGTFINRRDFYLPSHEDTDLDMKPFTQREISFGLEQILSEDVSASVRFVRKSVLSAVEDIGIQMPWGVRWMIGNPGYGISLNQKDGGQLPDEFPATPKAKREYAGLNISLEKRLSNNWMGGFSYTCSRLWGNFSGLAQSSGTGYLNPNETGFFDFWFRAFDKNLNPIDDVLFTDRPHSFKLYGSYTFDFGLTLGLVSRAMSGIPKERRVNAPRYWWPDGFLTDGRTPFLWTTDIYVEYTMNIGKYALQMNLNVTNLFDAKTAQSTYYYLNRVRIITSNEEILSGNWDYRDKDYVADPRFLMEYNFYPPIVARIGVKFIF